MIFPMERPPMEKPRGSACAQNQHVGQGEEEIRQAPGSWQLPQELPVPGPWAERRRGGEVEISLGARYFLEDEHDGENHHQLVGYCENHHQLFFSGWLLRESSTGW